MPSVVLEDLQSGETVEIAALVTDTYGRQFMCCDIPYEVREGSDCLLELDWPLVVRYPRDPELWELE